LFEANTDVSFKAGLRSRKQSEVFGWSRSRIFCPTADVQLDHFLHHIPKLPIPVEMVQFLLKLLLKQRFRAVHHDSLISVKLAVSPFTLRSRSRKFCKGRIWCRLFCLQLRNPDLKAWLLKQTKKHSLLAYQWVWE